MSLPENAAAKLQLAFVLHEAGVAIRRESLRREHPDASDERLDELLAAWLRTRPGAEFGDGVGRQGDVSRFQ